MKQNHPHKKSRHFHPLYFSKTFVQALPVFFLPLLQALLTEKSPSLYLIFGSVALALYLFLLWQQSRWEPSHSAYGFRSGLFLRRSTLLPRRWSLAPFRDITPSALLTGAVFFQPGVPAPGCESIPLFRRHSPRLPRPSKRKRKPHHAGILHTLLASALLSNPASGLLLATVFFRSVSSLLGTEIAQRIVNAADQRVRLIALGIPPAIAGISWLFLAGWFLAFLKEAMALLPFGWKREGNRLFFKMGVWPRRETTVSLDSVSSATLLQTLPMALLGISRAEAFLPGGGRVILHPALWRKERTVLRLFWPQKEPDLRPHRGAWFSFLWLPCVAFFLLILLEQRLLPVLDFLLPVFPLLLLPALWFFFMRLLGYWLSSLVFDNGSVYMRGIRIFTLFTARIDPAHITGVQFLQNPAQRFTGRCTLVIQTTGGWAAQYKLCHIPLSSAQAWVKKYLGIAFENGGI